jgi:hypothetical protein
MYEIVRHGIRNSDNAVANFEKNHFAVSFGKNATKFVEQEKLQFLSLTAKCFTVKGRF